MVRPSPVPPWRRAMPLSPCSKASNTRCSVASSMPGPVSRTVICTRLIVGECSAIATTTSIDPRSVNLSALPTRFDTIWRTRPASPVTWVRTVSLSNSMCIGRVPICGVRLRTVSATSAGRSKGSATSRSLPASALAKSSTSLRMRSSVRPDCSARCR